MSVEAAQRILVHLAPFISRSSPRPLAGGTPLGLVLFVSFSPGFSCGLGQTRSALERGRKGNTVGAVALARGETGICEEKRATGGHALGPSRKREGKPKRPRERPQGKHGCICEEKRVTGVTVGALAQARGETGIWGEARNGKHGWGPRASARGNHVRGGGATNPGSPRALHFPEFPPAFGRGHPSWAGSFCLLFSRFFLRTRPNAKRPRERPQGKHGWGPRASARGNRVTKRRGKHGRKGEGPRASARGNRHM
jgi:hypothetical protein